MSWPVGLLGFVRKMIRVRLVTRIADLPRLKREVGLRRDRRQRVPPAALHEDGVHLERRRRDDRFGHAVRACVAPNAVTVSRQQPLVEAVGQHQLRLAHAKILRALAR